MQITLRIVGYHFPSQLTSTHDFFLIYSQDMHKKFEINHTKIKSSCQSGRKKVTHNSKSDLPLILKIIMYTVKNGCIVLKFSKTILKCILARTILGLPPRGLKINDEIFLLTSKEKCTNFKHGTFLSNFPKVHICYQKLEMS